MKTAKTNVEGTCYIWAYPKTDYEISTELDAVAGDMTKVIPFKYVITSNSANWRDDAVLVHEFPVTGMVPAGVDLVKAAVETLRTEIQRVQKEAADKVLELEEKIKNLALIEYQPEG